MSDDRLGNVFACWEPSKEFCERMPPPPAQVLARIGREFGTGLARVYAFGDSVRLGGGDLSFAPAADSGDTGLFTGTDRLRRWGWEFPSAIRVFGWNGGGDPYGLGVAGGRSPPVIAVGSADVFTITPPSIESFLLLQTALLSVWSQIPATALDGLRLPDTLRLQSDEIPDEYVAALRRWAGAELPEGLSGDPYDDRLTEDEMTKVVEQWSRG